MSKVIKVENLSKAYQLGDFGTGTISRDLERFWARMRGKEDPFLKIGETNDRTTKGESDIVWSLKDINFEVEQGDAVGIIGRNGAGKSTLLKVLSRVTSPTTGSVKVKGRIASLLEVGTGFHPELTGRENIYLNGAILGMRKAEIKRKFDEIVDFSGVERYVDTPVKRYSSGMYVRLAFAVAAHLESEILIIDEVLAVGDAEFQKKCLGKMGDVSKGEGRTVLFVSHNMAAIKNLCSECILLNNGSITDYSNTNKVISQYLKNKASASLTLLDRKDRQGDQYIYIIDFAIKDLLFNEKKNIASGDSFILEITLGGNFETVSSDIEFALGFNNSLDERITFISNKLSSEQLSFINNKVYIQINKIALPPGEYWITTFIKSNGVINDWLLNAFCIDIELDDFYPNGLQSLPAGQGHFYMDYKYI
jgi:lipopolysaccharide transport system ATP-binding protein